MLVIQLKAGGQQHDVILELQSDLVYRAAVVVASGADPLESISHHGAIVSSCEYGASFPICIESVHAKTMLAHLAGGTVNRFQAIALMP